MNEFHGLEEYLPKAVYSDLYDVALAELKTERDQKIINTIKDKVNELRKVESDIKILMKKKQKLEGQLKGYSRGQVQDAEKDVDTEKEE